MSHRISKRQVRQLKEIDMSTTRIHIGTDTSITEALGAEVDARVYVEAQNGEVRIVGPFDCWMGYKVVRVYETQEQAESLAWDIARNPVAEFDRMGYDHAVWFKPASA
jgi:hypothetical protein